MIHFHFYKFYIKGTSHKEQVTSKVDFLCTIKPSLKHVLATYSPCTEQKVFLSTIPLKHIYDRHIFDKKNPKEFQVVLNNLTKIIRYPDEVRRNLKSKRGDFLFVKEIDGQLYLVSLEVGLEGTMQVVSSYATGEKYIKKFTLLWSWGTANPPS